MLKSLIVAALVLAMSYTMCMAQGSVDARVKDANGKPISPALNYTPKTNDNILKVSYVGAVVDSRDEKKITGAVVYIQEVEAETYAAKTTSDAGGAFTIGASLEDSRKWNLVVVAEGFQLFSMPVNPKLQKVTVHLTPM